MDHTDIVAAAKARNPLTTRESFGPFIVDLVQSLPVEPDGSIPGLYQYEKESDGSDLVQVNGTWVSPKRVAYSDGHLFKVLSDAGPGGRNGPEFVDDGFDAGRFLALTVGNLPNPVLGGPTEQQLLQDLDLRVTDLQNIGNSQRRKMDDYATKADIEQMVNEIRQEITKAGKALLPQILAILGR